MSLTFNAFPIVELSAYSLNFNDIPNDVICAQIIEHDDYVDPNMDMLLDNNHTYYEDMRLPNTKEISSLKLKIAEAMSEIAGREYVVTEAWSIILEPGQSISAHSHCVHGAIDPNDYFAFAYYPFAPPGSSDLQFLSTHSNVISTTVSAPVSTGTLLIFNSYLIHWTHRQHGNSIRVNVSGNLAPVTPNTRPADDWSKYQEGS